MKYRTIVADPPWRYDRFGGFNQAGKDRERVEYRRALPYPSMSVSEIAALPVARLMDPGGCNVFLWTTNRYLPEAFGVLAAWGASYSQTLVWHKTGANPTTGGIAPTSCEYLLYGRFGGGCRLTGRLDDSLVETPRVANRHSTKPDVFIDLLEQMSPGPYLEMFARRARFGWDYWGDESFGTAEMPAA